MNTEFPGLGDACDFVHIMGGKMIGLLSLLYTKVNWSVGNEIIIHFKLSVVLCIR